MDGAAALNVRFGKDISTFDAWPKSALFTIMTSISLIGNSHLGALKLGWPAIEADFPDVDLDFYASAGDSLDLVVSGGHIEPATEGVRTRLAHTSGKNGDIGSGYDAYVVCGLLLSSLRAARVYRVKMGELRSKNMAHPAAKEASIGAACEALRSLLFANVLAKLRQITTAPIFLIGTPLPALERHPNMEKFDERLRASLKTAYETASERIAQEFDARFVRQPPETTGPIELTTKSEFYLLSTEHVRNEKAVHTHMNAAYGAIVLKDILERIRVLAAV